MLVLLILSNVNRRINSMFIIYYLFSCLMKCSHQSQQLTSYRGNSIQFHYSSKRFVHNRRWYVIRHTLWMIWMWAIVLEGVSRGTRSNIFQGTFNTWSYITSTRNPLLLFSLIIFSKLIWKNIWSSALLWMVQNNIIIRQMFIKQSQ